MTSSSIFFEVTVSGVVTVFFYKWLTRIPKIGNTSSEFCPIPGDWGELRIPNLARMSLMELCYWMLQIAKVTAFTLSELLKENQRGGGKKPSPPLPPSPRLGLNMVKKYRYDVKIDENLILQHHCPEVIYRVRWFFRCPPENEDKKVFFFL